MLSGQLQSANDAFFTAVTPSLGSHQSAPHALVLLSGVVGATYLGVFVQNSRCSSLTAACSKASNRRILAPCACRRRMSAAVAGVSCSIASDIGHGEMLQSAGR